MAFRPIPTDRLSILTDRPNMKKPGIVIRGFSSSLVLDIIRSIPIYARIIVAIKSVLIRFILLRIVPKFKPIRGIMK